MKLSKNISKFTLLAIFVANGLIAFAQPATTSLNGSVTDAQGSIIPGAVVTISDIANGRTATAVTDTDGSFQFRPLEPGAYRLKIEGAGFKSLVRERVELLVATPATLSLQLEVGDVNEQVVVSDAAAPTINAQDATVGNPLNERQIKNLPFAARNPVTMLTLQPGVTFTGESDTDLLQQGSNQNLDDREGFVNGIRGNQSNVSLDGANSNDFETQATFTSVIPVTLDSLQEFRVTTSTANATDGVSGGAQIQLVTKSGSNDFRGNARWYSRNTRFAANSFFNNLAGIEKPKLERDIFGGSLGGRLIKDRTFFFVDYEARRDDSEETVDRVVPSATLRQGILSYESNNGKIVSLNVAQVLALDPANQGVNAGMQRYFAQYPSGNNPAASPDGGLNYDVLRFNAPIKTRNHLYTARFDHNLTASGTHSLFWRGSLADINTTLTPAQFPDARDSAGLINTSKGFVAGYTAAFTQNHVNAFRYSFTRQSVDNSGASGIYFNTNYITPFFPGATEFQGFPADPKGRRVPVHEISDDLTVLRGDHSLQFGGTFRRTRNSRFDQGFAFPYYNINAGDCVNGCNDALDRLVANNGGNTGLNPANGQAFTNAYVLLVGAIPSIRAAFQANPQDNSIFPQGTGRVRTFAEDGFEIYGQDAWRLRPNLTITGGLRYSYYTPIWETNSRMLRPNFDVRDWWETRIANMLAGLPSDASPLISYDLAGKANNRPAWYAPDTNNLAPRIAVAYSPDFKSGVLSRIFGGAGKSVIRGGVGLYYQRVGSTLAITTDRWGNPGLSTLRFSPRNQFGLANAPRFAGACDLAGCTGMPPVSQYLTPQPPLSLPFTPPATGSSFHFMVDSRLETPYSIQSTVSFQRELPKKMLLDVAYVGTFGRKLLSKSDFSTALADMFDPQSGQSLWQAYNRVIDIIGNDPFNPRIDPSNAGQLATIPSIAFFQNMLPNLPQFIGQPNLTPTQAFYVLAANTGGVWTQALVDIDFPNGNGVSAWNTRIDPQRDGLVLTQPQYFYLPAWLNDGISNYNSLQISLRRNVGGAQFGINYVFSKSLDNGSASENATLNSGTFFPSASVVANPFDPKAHYARSDYDVRHNFNAYWTVDLPIGRGRNLGRNMKGVVDAILGGWTTTGVWRWRSGFPISADGPDFNFASSAVVPAGLRSRITRNGPGGRPNLFADPAAARASLGYTRPGEVGSRNVIDGPGYFNIDLGLHKRFGLPWSERQNIEFRVLAFNTFNNANFSIRPPNYDHFFNLYYDPPQFGQLKPLNSPREGARELEFALRFSF